MMCTQMHPLQALELISATYKDVELLSELAMRIAGEAGGPGHHQQPLLAALLQKAFSLLTQDCMPMVGELTQVGLSMWISVLSGCHEEKECMCIECMVSNGEPACNIEDNWKQRSLK